eukprot:8592299-Alexandrium_andersonii.AAC.1
MAAVAAMLQPPPCPGAGSMSLPLQPVSSNARRRQPPCQGPRLDPGRRPRDASRCPSEGFPPSSSRIHLLLD